MADRELVRIGSVSAMLGAVILVVTNLLHTRGFEFGDTADHFAAVADDSLYLGDHIGLLVGALMMSAGLIALSRSLRDAGGAAWAFLGLAAAIVGAGLMVVLIAIDGIALTVIADQLADDPSLLPMVGIFEEIGLGLFAMLIFFTFGITYILYGLAVSLSDTYPKWLGWAALALGIAGAAIGVVQAYEGPSDTLTNILFPIVSVLLTLWTGTMGYLMWKKSAA
jgi:hypothetical protein